jgi:hypothetical protein
MRSAAWNDAKPAEQFLFTMKHSAAASQVTAGLAGKPENREGHHSWGSLRDPI